MMNVNYKSPHQNFLNSQTISIFFYFFFIPNFFWVKKKEEKKVFFLRVNQQILAKKKTKCRSKSLDNLASCHVAVFK